MSALRAAPSGDRGDVALSSSALTESTVIALERAHMVRQPPRQVAKHVADREHAGDGGEVVERARRADLNGKAPTRFLITVDRDDRFPAALDGAILQGAGQLFRLDLVVGEQGTVDVLAQRLGFGRHQIATDPLPDRIERHARETSDAFVIGGIVGEERLERREKQASRVADARHLLPGTTDRAAQFLQHQIVGGDLLAAQAARARAPRRASPGPPA